MTTTESLRMHCVALNLADGFGPRLFRRLLDEGIAPSEFFLGRRPLKELGAQVRASSAADLLSRAERELSRAAAQGVEVVTWYDDGYPAPLRTIYDPPPVLYLRGASEILERPMAAVVGSRRATPYGLTVARALGRGAGDAGHNVVSGMAAGIDTAAHRGVLTGTGVTTAVFGCGVDVIYPAANRKLAAEIAARGLLVSELPLGTAPDRFTFPRRNRIISGLSRVTVVVEAGEKSGALLTADFAAEQGREVMAVPGPVTSPLSAGCHRLIRDGATLCRGVEDLRQVMEPDHVPQGGDTAGGPRPALSADESSLLERLGGETLPLEEIVDRTGFTPQKTLTILLALELRGLVTQHPGQRYLRTAGDS
jgi:DNA processing protein